MFVPLPGGKRANVSIVSLLIPTDEFLPQIDRTRQDCMTAGLSRAVEVFGEGQRFTIRDLNASDMGSPLNVFTETSHATISQWNAMANCNAFTVARATVLCIYGIKIYTLSDAAILFAPITGVRIDVGGARIAQWQVQSIDQYIPATSTTTTRGYCGVTMSPVVVSEDITVTMFEYTRTASKVYTPVWMGMAIEKEGVTLKP